MRSRRSGGGGALRAACASWGNAGAARGVDDGERGVQGLAGASRAQVVGKRSEQAWGLFCAPLLDKAPLLRNCIRRNCYVKNSNQLTDAISIIPCRHDLQLLVRVQLRLSPCLAC